MSRLLASIGITICLLVIVLGSIGLINSYTKETVDALRDDLRVDVSCPEPVVKVSTNNTVIREETVIRETNIVYKEVSEQCEGVSIKRLETTDFIGSSMQPEIYSHYTGLIKAPNSHKRYVEGDVVVYTSDDGVRTAHRVSGVYSDYLVVCPLNDYGTGQRMCDHVAPGDVEGVICGVIYG
jgi:hypothetical protein